MTKKTSSEIKETTHSLLSAIDILSFTRMLY